MSTSTAKPIVQYGLTEVYTATDPQVDVVLVHGLNGHPQKTWSTVKPDVFWPADLLPAALEDQRPRILTYGYDANVTAFTDGVSKDRIHNHAEHLASRLVANRSLRKALERPIIFVCHSLGGLVVKRCLIYCQSIRHHQHTERLRSIYVSTYGILFLGTPHNGSDLAKWGSLLEKICSIALPKKFIDTQPQLVQALKTNNETLQNINRLFIEIIGRFHIYFFHESKPMDLKGTREFVVDEDSAAPVIEGVERMGIERDHSHMCKFEDESAPGYDVVAEAIQRYATDAPPRIRSRWDEERRVAEFERQAVARELLGDSMYQMSGAPSAQASGNATPSTTGGHHQAATIGAPPPKQIAESTPASTPYEIEEVEEDFATAPHGTINESRLIEPAPPISLSSSSAVLNLLVAPVGFRPNSIFLGFQMEMDQLRQKLANKKRRSIGTCAALLWGPPGSGKSQIAREYLWRSRSEYPAGSFWVDCKTKESRAKSFWEIGQAVAILNADRPRDPAWDESTKYVDAVRKWFEAREGWLLVFDGVTTDNDDDIDAFLSFIPDRSGNSVIYTSVDRTLAKRQRLLNPAGIKVYPLSTRDACLLLYKNLGIKEPTTQQAKKANQLVKYYECLPLAIHAAAHALIATGKSLDKYSAGVSDHRLAEPFEEILAALRHNTHPEAVNLVTILSFFGHIIPVAMLRFGNSELKELGVDIRSIGRVGSMKKELDNTIAVLIRYGLVERTLLSYSVPSPYRSLSPELRRQSRAYTTSTLEDDASIGDGHHSSSHSEANTASSLEEGAPSNQDRSSDHSVTYSIDILKIHTVVQTVLRDELRYRYRDRPDTYWWWLSVAAQFLCKSYAVADDKIRSSEGPGLVRDYRDYETHAARLWSHFPKSSQDALPMLRKARHHLHQAIRAIRSEIKNRSPSQSIDSIQRRVQASVFERSNSTSSDSPGSDSDLTRTSTWTLDDQTESPIQMNHAADLAGYESEDSWTDKWSQSGMGNSRILPSGVSTRRQSYGEHDTPLENGKPASRRPSVLQAIFQGLPAQPKKQRDLGEWKPVPIPPALTHAEAQSVRSRDSSLTNISESTRPTSAGSDASKALAKVHKASPPTSRERVASSSRPHSTDRSGSEERRQPLTAKSPNLPMSPLAAEFYPSQSLPTYTSTDMARHHRRNPSASPRLMQAALNNQASRMLPPLDIEENISITRRVAMADPAAYPRYTSSHDIGNRPSVNVPSGYTSQPMSRDTSRESNFSLATAPPAVPGSASLSASPQIREPYLYSRPGLASIDVVAANSLEDDLIGLDDSALLSPITAYLSDSLMIERRKEVQFGDMSPVDIEAGRARASLAREKSMERSIPLREVNVENWRRRE